jgi:hypothetical protein
MQPFVCHHGIGLLNHLVKGCVGVGEIEVVTRDWSRDVEIKELRKQIALERATVEQQQEEIGLSGIRVRPQAADLEHRVGRKRVGACADAGASLVVSPNTRPDVIAETVRLGLESYPGAATPTEAFAALDAGATAVKIFPATTVGVAGMRAWASVLPAGTRLVPVGGVGASTLGDWARAAADGAGVGTSLYRPGDAAADVAARAAVLARAWAEAPR